MGSRLARQASAPVFAEDDDGAPHTPLTTEATLRALLIKQMAPLVALALVLGLLVRHASTLDAAQILNAARDIGTHQWLMAALATGASFWVYGKYEAAIHRLNGTGIEAPRARIGGIGAVGVSQFTGFGLLVGTMARWRMFPDLTLWQSMRVTVAVSLSFMLCLAVLAAGAVAVSPLLAPVWRFAGAAGVAVAAAFLLATLWRPRFLFRLPLPPIGATARLLVLTAADTAFAALALYVLLPLDAVPPPGAFYAMFLMALGLGLVGTTPAGVGPFEYMCLTTLTMVPEASLLAAIVGFRLIYYALPAFFGLSMLAVAPALRRRRPDPGPTLEPGLSPATARGVPKMKAEVLSFIAHRAEAGLMRQGGIDILHDVHHRPLAIAAEAGQSVIMLSDPLRRGSRQDRILRALQLVAKRSYRTPALYKCGGRTAVVARAVGWKVLPVSAEAWLTPATFDLEGSCYRQLRRQLRKAEKAGVQVENARARGLPLARMEAVAETWEAQQGGARGLSMGRFSREYVATQTTYLAYHEGRLVAFVTFHDSVAERTLDLVCHDGTAPVGTMHMLVTRAIEDARQDGVARVSLAAVPRDWPLPGKLGDFVRRKTGAAGLKRFKESFAPRWEPLYVAAPSWPGLVLAGIDLVDRITRPRPKT